MATQLRKRFSMNVREAHAVLVRNSARKLLELNSAEEEGGFLDKEMAGKLKAVADELDGALRSVEQPAEQPNRPRRGGTPTATPVQ